VNRGKTKAKGVPGGGILLRRYFWRQAFNHVPRFFFADETRVRPRLMGIGERQARSIRSRPHKINQLW